MKPVTLVLTIVWLLLLAGGLAWFLDHGAGLPSLSVWLWIAALIVLCVPLLLLCGARVIEFLRCR